MARQRKRAKLCCTGPLPWLLAAVVVLTLLACLDQLQYFLGNLTTLPANNATAVSPGTAAAPMKAAHQGPNFTIYTYWHYPKGPDPYVLLNVETWRAHTPPGTEVVLVNDSNVASLVPDIPEEFFRLPYAAAKSDAVRAAVLYHRGGLYMDTDFLAMGPVGSVPARLGEGFDVIAYASDGQGFKKVSSSCTDKDAFASNFMATKAGNLYSKTWWQNIKAFAQEPEKRDCFIPWAHLEHLKTPANDHDAKPNTGICRVCIGKPLKPTENRTGPAAEAMFAMVERGKVLAKPIPAGPQLYCLRGLDGLAPHVYGEVYWQAWDPELKATDPKLSGKEPYESQYKCHERGNGDLVCDVHRWGNKTKVFPRFFNHVAYHLFFATSKKKAKSKEEILGARWLVSEMYRRALTRD